MLCDVCGSEMVIKVAKKGPNAGNSFWGCSNFPHCRKIVPLEPLEEKALSNSQSGNTHIDNTYSEFYASPISSDHEVYFFNSMALSNASVIDIAYDEDKYSNFINYSKFRVDYKGERIFFHDKQQSFYALILRLLNRGKLTYISETSEIRLINRFHSKLGDIEVSNLKNYSTYKDIIFPNDSPLELSFLNHVIQPIFGENWASFVSSQVHLSSLLTSDQFDYSSQRVDFLVSYNQKHLVVEIDGDEHELHKDKDQLRDEALEEAGYDVLRISNTSLKESGFDSIIETIEEILEIDDFDYVLPNVNQKTELAIKIIHQWMVAISKGLESGYLTFDDQIKISGYSNIFSIDDLNVMLDLAIEELSIIVKAFSKIYDVDMPFQLKQTKNESSQHVFHISFGQNQNFKREAFIKDIQSKGDFYCQLNAFDQLAELHPDEQSLKVLLNYVYRFNEFQEGQIEAITRLLKRKDSVVLLPTGSGKSLIYQLTSLVVPGLTMIIAPITSLMDDQVDNLLFKGIDNAIAIYSEVDKLTRDTKTKRLKANNISMAYISPERLQTRDFRNQIKALLVQNSVFTVAIDEAHCVSEWGHDFRTAYLNIGRNSREIFKKNNMSPVIVALTGTASTAVLKDVKREIQITDYEATITPKTFNRKELNFSIYSASSDSKSTTLNEIIKSALPTSFRVSSQKFLLDTTNDDHSGIIFCPHVNGDFGVLGVKQDIQKNLGMSVNFYSGSAPKGVSDFYWNKNKKEIASEFKRNKTKLLVATKAFGMGIDKPNIRYTIHYGIPGSIESYYQEAGRAGRDRSRSECIIVFSNEQDRINDKLLNVNTSLEEITRYMDEIKRPEQDDISRMLFFHVRTFSGVENELEGIRLLISRVYRDGDEPEKSMITIASSKEKRNEVEKSVHRLVLLGVIKDYSIDYSANEFDMMFGYATKEEIINNYLNYVKGYNEGRVKQERLRFEPFMEEEIRVFVYKASEILIKFVYDTIERGRRRALNEMVQLSKAALKSKDPDSTIRNRIIRYFESTFSIEIDEMLENPKEMLKLATEIFEGKQLESGESLGGIRSPKDAEELRGQVSKYLESYPDHPGLLFLRSLSELYSIEYDLKTLTNDYLAGIKFSLEKYGKTEEDLLKFIQYYLVKAIERSDEVFEQIYTISITEVNENKLNDVIIHAESSKEAMRNLSLMLIIDHQNKKLFNMTKED